MNDRWTIRWLRRGLIAAGVLYCSLALAFTPPPFPRLGGDFINAPQNYENAAYQAQMARLHVVVLNVWPGWSGGGTTMQQAVTAMKKLNPNLIVTLYMDINEFQRPASATWSAIQTKLTSMNWWLYHAGSSGAMVKST